MSSVQVLENKDYVAVHLESNSLVYEKGNKNFTDPPLNFSTSRAKHEEITLGPEGNPLPGGRWSKMPRREAEAWYHRALKYVKSLEKRAVGLAKEEVSV